MHFRVGKGEVEHRVVLRDARCGCERSACPAAALHLLDGGDGEVLFIRCAVSILHACTPTLLLLLPARTIAEPVATTALCCASRSSPHRFVQS